MDVRDLAAFLLDQVEEGASGGYNVAPRPTATYGDMLRACAEVTAGRADRPVELIWADEDWLVEQRVTQWTELPLWRNAAAPWAMNVDRAHTAGLRCRLLAETVADTWAWLGGGGRAVDHERFAEHGIAPDKERALIERWLARAAQPVSASSRTPD